MKKRIILAILIALAIAAPAASQNFTIVDCDGIQVEYIGYPFPLETFCSFISSVSSIPETADMEVSEIVFYQLEATVWRLTLHLVLDSVDDFSLSMSLMDVGYGIFVCETAETIDVTLIYDVDLRVDIGDSALLFDLAAGSYTCPDGDIDKTVLYDNSALSWDSLVEYTPE